MPGIQPIVGDIVQNRIQCRASDQISLNVLHYRVTAVVGGGLTLLQMAQQQVLPITNSYRPWMPILATVEQTSFQNVTLPATVPYINGINVAGTAIGNLVPKQVSGLIHGTTGMAGRSQRSRTYVGFVSDTFITGAGELNGAGFAVLVNIASALGPLITLTLGGISTTLRLIVRHPNTPGPIIIVNGTDIITFTAESGLATQRRRGDFGRSN